MNYEDDSLRYLIVPLSSMFASLLLALALALSLSITLSVAPALAYSHSLLLALPLVSFCTLLLSHAFLTPARFSRSHSCSSRSL